jgi:hypothetical protein
MGNQQVCQDGRQGRHGRIFVITAFCLRRYGIASVYQQLHCCGFWQWKQENEFSFYFMFRIINCFRLTRNRRERAPALHVRLFNLSAYQIRQSLHFQVESYHLDLQEILALGSPYCKRRLNFCGQQRTAFTFVMPENLRMILLSPQEASAGRASAQAFTPTMSLPVCLPFAPYIFCSSPRLQHSILSFLISPTSSRRSTFVNLLFY